ncbi:MAG: hypothetical protein J6K58_09210 [Lachnospiraceae bacterium]|nr:hypothetical protein [Lachnospiraceae bacterium]
MKKYIMRNDNCTKEIIKEKVGGKAQSLFSLCKLRLNIPDFFVITTDAYHDFLCTNGIDLEIKDLFEKKEYGTIRNLIMEQEIPDDIWKEIWQTYDLFDMDIVSVRSSALLEDGKRKSFAGQFDSFLFVPFQDLQKSIKKCWASYYNDNAVEYADQIVSFSGMAVIVQRMVDAEISGIGFSKSPVANYEDCVFIEAASGVGENIVSGIITPNQYFYSIKKQRFFNPVSNNLLSSNMVEALASNICKIQELYQIDVDTEWCIKDGVIYFLQARPITAIEKRPKPYKKTLVRPLPLMRVELYAMGEYEGIKWLTDGQFYFNPLFIYELGKVIVYYNNISQKENPINMYSFLCNHYDAFLKKYEETIVACDCVERMINGDMQFILNDFISAILKIYPFSSLGNLAGNLPEVLVGKVYDVFKEFRQEKGELLTIAEEFLLQKAESLVDNNFLYFYTINEAFGKTSFDVEQLVARKQGYMYFNKMLLVERNQNEINRFLNANHIALLSENETDLDTSEQLSGTAAYGGKIKGVVTIVTNENDFYKMEQGDILVASMTVPKFLPIMKKASAMVTDEGGVLCHAAIVARELEIPTIIGTKWATSVLDDGDLIEVDANNARVKILTKGYRKREMYSGK